MRISGIGKGAVPAASPSRPVLCATTADPPSCCRAGHRRLPPREGNVIADGRNQHAGIGLAGLERDGHPVEPAG